MLTQNKKRLPKKLINTICAICLIIACSIPKKVNASDLTENVRADTDAVVSGVSGGAIGIVAIGALVGTVASYGEGVLSDVYEASKLGVSTLSSTAKTSLYSGIDWTKGKVSWTAEQVNTLLDAISPNVPPPAVVITSDMGTASYTESRRSFVYVANSTNNFQFDINGYTLNRLEVFRGVGTIYDSNLNIFRSFVTVNNQNYNIPYPYNSQNKIDFETEFNIAVTSANLSKVMSLLNQLENFHIDLMENNVALTPYPDVLNKINSTLRDKPLTLGLPTATPYASNGTKLKLLDGAVEGSTGVTADGTTPYTGNINWRHDYNEGMSLPAPQMYNPTGQPVLTLDGVLVTADGKIVPRAEVSDLTTTYPTIAYEVVNGEYVPTFTTATGTKINAITGAIIGAIALEVTPGTPPGIVSKPEKNPIKPNKPTGRVGTISNLLPLAVAAVFFDILKAIAYYCVRLFNFVVSLPLTPSKRIDNETFNWFRNMTWLGVRIYDFTLTFAMLAASMSLFKFFRRIV